MRYFLLSWIAFLIANIAHIIIIYTYFSSLFKSRYSKKITISVFILLTSINFLFIFANNAIINTIVGVLTLFTLVQFFKGKLINRLLFAIFIYIAGFISEFIMAYILVSFSNVSPHDIQFGTPEFIYGLMFSRTLLAIIARALTGLAKNRKLPKLSIIQWVSLIVPPTGSVIVLYNFLLIRTQNIMDMISSIIVMLTSIAVITIYGKILLDYEVEIKNNYLEELVKYYKYQYFLAEKSEKLIMKTKHDIKNLLIGFQTGLQNQNISSVQNEIKKLLSEIDSFDGPAATGNLVIDSIINYKSSIVTKSDIHFSLDLHIPKLLSLDSIAICQILGSALDNAIEATDKVISRERIIQIKVSYEHDALFLQIINPYQDSIIAGSNYLMSSKRGYQTEGIGLQSITNIVAKQNGLISMDYKDETFYLSVTLYNVSMSDE